MKHISGRREAVDPTSAVHQPEEFGEHWCTLERFPRSEDDELRAGTSKGDVETSPILKKVANL